MMKAPMETDTSVTPQHRRRWPWFAGAAILAAVIGVGWWFGHSKSQEAQAKRAPQAIPVTTAKAETRDVPVLLKANGTVTALQTVDLRSQVTSTVREVHIREGQNVAKGDLLFSLDARADDANIRKAEAQVAKDRADLATATRTLERQRELFAQKFISQSALDAAQNQVDTLNGQMAVDQAALESTRVARGYSEIRAPFAGRTGTINVRAGSLVQPGSTGAALVTVTQIDPIAVSFTLPEKELAGLQQALAAGNVEVTVVAQSGGQAQKGRITFVDNAVESVSGTIRVKAEFANKDGRLWPGMYVNAELAPRILQGATVVPAQAVQTGPENRFVYVVGAERKVESKPVKLAYIDDGLAVVEGVAPGSRVVVEGAQNLRPGSVVTEATADGKAPSPRPSPKGEGADKAPPPKGEGGSKK
jgi:RND family efflux transporter MFP subunit